MSDGANIGFSATELERFRKQLRTFNAKKTLKLQQLTQITGNDIALKASKKVPKYLGALHNSIRPILGKSKLSVRVYASMEYAANVEFGTLSYTEVPPELSEYAAVQRSKKVLNFKKLYEDLKPWCKKRGIPESAAFPIARTIAKKGQRPHPFLYPAFKEEVPKYIKAITTVMQQPE